MRHSWIWWAKNDHFFKTIIKPSLIMDNEIMNDGIMMLNDALMMCLIGIEGHFRWFRTDQWRSNQHAWLNFGSMLNKQNMYADLPATMPVIGKPRKTWGHAMAWPAGLQFLRHMGTSGLEIVHLEIDQEEEIKTTWKVNWFNQNIYPLVNIQKAIENGHL